MQPEASFPPGSRAERSWSKSAQNIEYYIMICDRLLTHITPDVESHL
jgi:hypothetical protein